MTVLDTSVWVDYLRRGDPGVVGRVQQLLDQDDVGLPLPVRVEILSGASRADLPRLRRVLSALPALAPSGPTWERIDRWVERAVSAGERFGVGDLLIAAIAADHDAPVWSRDDDFARMAHLGFVQIYRPL